MVDTFKNNLNLSGTDLLDGAILSTDLTLKVLATPDDALGSAGLSATPPYNILIESELLRVTGVVAGTKTLTVTRGYRGTTAAGHGNGVGVDQVLTDDALLGLQPAFGTPALTLGTSNAAGSAASAVRTDATILAFDATVPVTQAFSDAAAAGTATVAARRDHKHGMPASPGGGGSLTSAGTALTGDVSMATANTYYDGPALSLAAGTWLIVSGVCLSCVAFATDFVAKLWDGSTVYASGSADSRTGNQAANITLAAIVTPGTTTTYKVSAAGDNNTSLIMAATPHSASGNNASWMVAVKIA